MRLLKAFKIALIDWPFNQPIAVEISVSCCRCASQVTVSDIQDLARTNGANGIAELDRAWVARGNHRTTFHGLRGPPVERQRVHTDLTRICCECVTENTREKECEVSQSVAYHHDRAGEAR